MLAAAIGGAGILAAPQAAAASTAQPVGPKQYFVAMVNGSTGETRPVTIAMACFGAIRPGQTGHPMSGQTVAVKEIFVPTPATTALGYTGNRATSIGAFFGPPPPASGAAPTYVNFEAYRRKAIPTSLVLPCAGSGHVTFVPLPLDPSEHGISVPVAFVGQP